MRTAVGFLLLLIVLASVGRAQDSATALAEGLDLIMSHRYEEAEARFSVAVKSATDPLVHAFCSEFLLCCRVAGGKLPGSAYGGDEHRRNLALIRAARISPDLAVLLKVLGNVLRNIGLHDEACPHLQRALAIRRSHHQGDHEEVAGTITSFAFCLVTAGRAREAIPLCEEAVAMRRRLHRGDHPELATTLGNLAHCLAALGRLEDSLAPLDEALAMHRRIESGDHAFLALAIHNRGTTLLELGRLEEALADLQTGFLMQYRLDRGDSNAMAVSLGMLGYCLERMGRYSAARAHLELARGMYARVHPAAHPDRATGLNNLGACLLALGRVEEALARFEEGREMCRALYAGDHPAVATFLSNIAMCRMDLGRPSEALAACEEVEAMFRRLHGGDHPDLAAAINNRAACLDALGRPLVTLSGHRAALEMYRRMHKGDHPALARSLSNVAYALSSLGRFREAEPLYAKSLEMYRRLHDGDHPDVALGLGNLAASLQELGRSSEARLGSIRCLSMWRRIHEGDHPHVALAMFNLGRTLHSAARPDDALPYLTEASDMYRRLQDPAEHLAAARLGWLHLERGETAAAARLFGEAIAVVERLRGGAGDLTVEERSRYYARLREASAFGGMVLAQLRLSKPETALLYLEQGRARGLLDLLERGRFDLLEEAATRARESSDAEAVSRIAAIAADLRETRREVDRLTWAVGNARSPGSPASARRREDDARLRSELAAARGRHGDVLRLRARLVADLVPMSGSVPPDEVRRRLAPRERMLVYHLTPFGSVLLLVPPEGGEIRNWELRWPGGEPVTLETADGAVDAFLQLIRRSARSRGLGLDRPDSGAGPRLPETGHHLFRALLPPEAWAEVRGASRVILLPHGPLHSLPFEALVVDPEAPLYWLDRGPAIVYAPSATAHLWSRDRRNEQRARAGPVLVLAIGDPVFSRAGEERPAPATRAAAHGGLAPLPGTRREVLAISEAYGGDERVTTLLGADAREGRLFELAPRARLLHLATHGLAEEGDQASWSSLALTLPPEATAADDGFLELVDLLERWRGRLRNCELTVLSACETRRGRLERDEGVFALPWGFHFAGCPSVIASQWRVADESTAELMAEFYRRLAAGESKLEAFTRARKFLRRKHPAPFHWAPFIYIGDPR